VDNSQSNDSESSAAGGIGEARDPGPSGIRVGYQGEPGAFGEGAARTRGVPVPFATFESLLQGLGGGEVDAVVLPVVNAVIGPVSEALVPLAEALGRGLAAEGAGAVEVPVKLALAGAPGTTLASIKRARSHPAALRQCARRLGELGLTPVEELDTAGAAHQLARELAAGLPAAREDAVICPAAAALDAGLIILNEDVSDRPPNLTRFVHLRRALPVPAPAAEATIPALRARIDALDTALAGLLVQRLETARMMGAVKKAAGKATVDPAREVEVRARLRAALPGREALAGQLADLLVAAGRAEQGA
jgi:prephenate dehydratase